MPVYLSFKWTCYLRRYLQATEFIIVQASTMMLYARVPAGYRVHYRSSFIHDVSLPGIQLDVLQRRRNERPCGCDSLTTNQAVILRCLNSKLQRQHNMRGQDVVFGQKCFYCQECQPNGTTESRFFRATFASYNFHSTVDPTFDFWLLAFSFSK